VYWPLECNKLPLWIEPANLLQYVLSVPSIFFLTRSVILSVRNIDRYWLVRAPLNKQRINMRGWSSHGIEDIGVLLLGSDAMWTFRQAPTFRRNLFSPCEIAGSHGGEQEDDCLPGYCAVYSGRNWRVSQKPAASIIRAMNEVCTSETSVSFY
jgi:hypothetical protein